VLTSLPAKHKVGFTLDGKPYEVWVTSDMTQLRDAASRSSPATVAAQSPRLALARAWPFFMSPLGRRSNARPISPSSTAN